MMISKIINMSKQINKIVIENGKDYIKRNKKTNSQHGLLFGLLHTEKDVSMDTVAAGFNTLNIREFKAIDTIARQSFLNRYNSLPLEFYENVSDKIGTLIDNMNKKNYTHQILAVDGSEFFKKLEELNLRYVCRLRYNMSFIPKDNVDTTIPQTLTFYDQLCSQMTPNMRYIS